MSWEEDKGIIIFFIVMGILFLFCIFMAIRSSKKQKQRIESGIETKKQQLAKQEHNKSYIPPVFGIVIGIIWLLSAGLIFLLYSQGSLSGSFQIPRILSFFYEFLGIQIGSIVQFILSVLMIVSSIKDIISIKKHKV